MAMGVPPGQHPPQTAHEVLKAEKRIQSQATNKDKTPSENIKKLHLAPPSLALPTQSMQQLSDTEMTSFLTPTATEKLEQGSMPSVVQSNAGKTP